MSILIKVNEDERHFDNPYEDYADNTNQLFALLREKMKGKQILYKWVKMFLAFTKLRKDQDEHAFVGDTGIAYTLYRLSKCPCISGNKREEFLTMAQKIIDEALEKNDVKVKDLDPNWYDLVVTVTSKTRDVGIVCGDAGLHMLSAAISNALHLKQKYKYDIARFKRFYNVAMTEFSTRAGDVFLVGRAGYLSGLYWLNKECPEENQIDNDALVLNICKLIYNNGRNYAKKNKLDVPLMYACHEKEYLGAANGISGILFMMLKSPLFKDYPNGFADDYDGEHRKICEDIKCTIDSILDLQDHVGNFPMLYREQARHLHHKRYYNHKWLQWCDGTPGIVYLMAKSYLIFNDRKYLESCERASDYIWKYGLTLNGRDICNGIIGNAYTFLLMYRVTKNPKYLYRALKFLEFIHLPEYKPYWTTLDFPYSLFLGFGGVICFLIDLLEPMNASFPFFDL